MPYYDAHAHLADPRFGADVRPVLDRAAHAGVERIMCCGAGPADWAAVARLGARQPLAAVSFGVHPWRVRDLPGDWLVRLETLCCGNPRAGIGEIGLDFTDPSADRDGQRAVFAAQLDLAGRLRRPVSIHCRKAWQALIETLEKHPARTGGMIHAWSGSPELVDKMQRMGLSISFGGAVTHARNRKARDSARAVDPGRLLIETDSPDMLPAGCAGPLNEPAAIVSIAREIAAIRGDTPEAIAELTAANARALFAGSPRAGAAHNCRGRTHLL
jgi:TatD DNase family protein